MVMSTVPNAIRRTALVLTALFAVGGILFGLGYAFEDLPIWQALLITAAIFVPLAGLTILTMRRPDIAPVVLTVAVGLFAAYAVLNMFVDVIDGPDISLIALVLALPIAVMGQRRDLWAGALMLVAGALLAPFSLMTPWIALALFIVGLGWNLCYISGSSLLSDTLAPAERGQYQGMSDLSVNASAALSSISSGFILAAFGYALSGRDVIPRSWAAPSNAAYSVLWTSLRDAGTNPQVCAALDTLGATYVLDFGPGEVYPGRWVMPGFTNIDGQPGFELVAREGAASLYEVTACG